MNDVSPVSFDEEAVEEENIEDDFNSDLDFEDLPSMEIEENQDVAEENEIESEVQNGLEEEITDEDFISEEEFEEPVREEDSLESEENPADFINIEDIAEKTEEPESSDEPFETQEDEEPFGVEDIFSQMEADAAANPVIKNQDEPSPKDNLYQQEEKVESESHSAPLRKLSEYKIPTDLLDQFQNNEYWRIDDETKAAGENLKKTLNEFGIEAEVTGIRKGPVVTMFELLPAPGVKLSKIVNLQDNIALALAAKSVRIVAPIPGRHAVGIEIPNKERAIVSFREIIEQNLPEYKKMAIPVILGKDISGQSQIIDIAKTPHLLIAGATGAGKSVCVNSIILSILYNRSPNDVKLIMVDPKVVELKLYNDIPHLLTPVVTEPKRALQVLQYCICEMERRYALLDGMGVRDIASYNTRIRERRIATEKLPYIVVIIDEFADLMATSGKELETNVARLTAMSRAVGIHLVLATQRPSVNVITGLIKANIPSRIAFMVASRQDSQIIIDSIGAEKLLGKGDMLYTSAVNPIPTRIQGTLVGDNEVERVVDYVKTFGGPDYIDDEIFVDDDEEMDEEPGLFSDGEDPLYDQALQIVIQAGKASASYIQRRLKIGYNRAARLVEDMEARGIVGPANGSKPREVIHVP
ncbi:MAG: DNA translocase FtsK [Treponema sp.]|nr:DNA translocase FtsK [Treponema sp.]